MANGARPNLDGHVHVRPQQVHTARVGALLHSDGALEWPQVLRLLAEDYATK